MSGEEDSETRVLWIERLRAVAKVQARYLWILLVMMVFYAALQVRVVTPTEPTILKLPVVDLAISGDVVLASGPSVLSFLVMAIIGTMWAYMRAREALGLSPEGAYWTGEELDTSPTGIDLAFYSTPDSNKLFAAIGHLGYSLFLLGAVGEAAWLWWRMISTRTSIPGHLFSVFELTLLMIAAWQSGYMLCRNARELPLKEDVVRKPRPPRVEE